MKLGEALARRAELQSRLGQVRDRLRVSALIQEGDEPPEDPVPLLAELDQIAGELEQLISAINGTNATTRLPSGATLTQALARRDVLGLKHSALKAVADATTQQQARYSRSEIRLVRTFDVADVRQRVDSLAREQRQLDVEIQAPALHGNAQHRHTSTAHHVRRTTKTLSLAAVRAGKGISCRSITGDQVGQESRSAGCRDDLE